MVVEETGCCDRRAIDALAELPEHERGGSAATGWAAHPVRRYPGIVQATGPVRRKSA